MLNEDNDEASDMRFDGRRAAHKKFNWHPVAPTFPRNQPFGENVEGLYYCAD